MLESSVIGLSRISYMNLGKNLIFSCYGSIIANIAAKELHIINIYRKEGPPNCQIGLPLNSSFL